MSDKQTRTISMIEQVLNVSTGYLLAFIVWSVIIIPLFKIEASIGESMLINLIFTVISVLRGYVWRRLFVNYLDKLIQNAIYKSKRG
jgi:hypothetical protein